jgi:Putative Actinobacterial Holin-X, holin superfamily III
VSDERSPEPPQNIAAAITDISERASVLIREEIELAKAEVTEKVTKLARGAIVGAVAGVFLLTALVMALFGGAWLLYYYLPGNDFTYFWGFFAMAVILVLFGVLAGLIAARAVKKGSPPVPTMAIAEAHKIREAVSTPTPPHVPTSTRPSTSPAAAAPAPATAAPPTPAPASAAGGLAADAVFAKPPPAEEGGS